MPKKLNDEESSVDSSSNDYNKDYTKSSTKEDNDAPPKPYYFPSEIDEELLKLERGDCPDEIYDMNMKRESKLPQASKASKAFKDQPASPPSSKAFKDQLAIPPRSIAFEDDPSISSATGLIPSM